MAQHSGLKKQLQLIGINTSSLNFENISSVVGISSPISGNISEIMVEQGAFVSETTPLIRIIDNQHLHLILTAFEKDALYLKKGQKVQFTLSEVSKERFSATIQLISNNINQNRMVEINAHLDNEKAMNFISGMFAKADIITDTHKAFGLPETAYAESDNNLYVLILNEKTDKGYYFDQVKIPSNTIYEGFVEIQEHTNKQFLNNKVFELIK
ncbi:efflux RND transporter periplasmic adaptor subunit [Capnocytophaga catalasegens]|uniref:efflux RND transporter periplasmic adaptor subunit n=1 Tax=Capnocytophaga catalasegens TaxID=1004260 RepID=UPI002232238C|nr:HlyD family efflux transporter periplasmic adaptor subunit [Capnocytophaga catalasegens]